MNQRQNDYISSRLRDNGANWGLEDDEKKEELFIECREFDLFGNLTKSYNPSTGDVYYEKPRK